MATIIQRRRGTTAQHATFTGAEGEITIDTDTKEIVVHDGVTPGGFPGGGYLPAGTGAVATNVQAKLRESPSVSDYNSFADYVTASSDGGFFNDDSPAGLSTRVRDRFFVGDAAQYTGNRLGSNGYGSSWTTAKGASYLIKNATMAVAPPELDASGGRRYGIVGFSKSMGVGAVAVNDGNNTFARALYVEVFEQGTGSSTSVGIEVQLGNYTSNVPVANAYSMSTSIVNGLYLGVESGVGYTVGDSDTLIPVGSNPAGAAIDIAGGSLNAAYQKWTTGIVLRSGALKRDGSDFAVALSLAQKHKIQWEIGAADTGASIWSEVTVNTQRVGLKFENRRVRVLGDGGRILVDTLDDTAGAGAVNYPVIRNARTAIAPAIGAEGTDTNIGFEVFSKGTGVTRFTSHAGTGENLRITPPASAPTDYLTMQGSAGSGVVTIGCAGGSANIDLILNAKGTGVLRFGTWTSNGDAAVNGYVSIRDAGGTIRKLATID
jgi:hypothetical protein